MILSDLHTLQSIVQELKKQEKTIVWTNGCFDIIHPGHLETFRFCKKQGDIVIVGINGDHSPYWKTKPGRPINDIHMRSTLLDSLKDVDFIYIFEEETPIHPIKATLPDVLVKGGDYKPENIVGYSEIMNHGGRILTIPIIGEYSTSSIIQKILRTYEA